jgi:ferric-dicitrate binding protein FerR (iron transport regulator)
MSTDDPTGERRPWNTEQSWAQLRERITAAETAVPVPDTTHRSWRASRAVRYSSLAAVLVGVIGTLVLRQPKRAQEARVVTTAAGERVTIRLADSSVITLGPASSVRYVLSDSLNSVELLGLADFRVRYDANRRFVVRARNAETVDIGTEFVVRAYESDSAVTVSVTEGRVALHAGTSREARELAAGTVGRVAKDGTLTIDRPADIALHSAWVSGQLAFTDQTLSAVAAELSRTFDVDIRIPDATLASRRISGLYAEPSVNGVLDAMTTALDARYERSGRLITLHPRGR